MTEPRAVLLMGVAGCGKSAVGRRLAERLGAAFIDADDHHPRANIDKMRRGVALTDADRWPWLDALAGRVQARLDAGKPVVLACSALRAVYRRRLGFPGPGRTVIELSLSRATLQGRLEARVGHFFGADLLDSQLATLESPGASACVDADAGLDTVVERVLARLTAGVDPGQ